MGVCQNHQMEYSDHPACTVQDGLNSYQNSNYDLSKVIGMIKMVIGMVGVLIRVVEIVNMVVNLVSLTSGLSVKLSGFVWSL